MPLTVKEALSEKPDQNVTLRVQCLEVSELIKTGDKSKFYAVIADASGSTTITVYTEAHYNNFTKGKGVMLQNVLNKQSYLAATSRSKTGLMNQMIIPPAVLANVPKLPNDGIVTIATSMNSPAKTYVSVRGKIMKMSPKSRKAVADNVLNFQEALLKDQTQTTKLALWGDLVDMLEVGDLVTVRKARVRLFSQSGKEGKKLTTTIYTKLEKTNESDELQEVEPLTSDEEDMLSADPEDANKGTLIALMFCESYYGCYKSSCKNVMTTTIKQGDTYKLQCKSCQTTFSAGIACKCALLRFLLETDDQTCFEINVFNPVIEELFTLKGMEYQTTMDLVKLQEQALQLLPLKIKYTVRGNVLQSVFLH